MWGPSFRTQSSSRRRQCFSPRGRAEGASSRKNPANREARSPSGAPFFVGPCVIPVRPPAGKLNVHHHTARVHSGVVRDAFRSDFQLTRPPKDNGQADRAEAAVLSASDLPSHFYAFWFFHSALRRSSMNG